MMDGKKALEEADGDFDKAVESCAIKGPPRAQKRAPSATAGNGLVAAAEGALIELDCETDFVAKNEQFQTAGREIVAQCGEASPATSRRAAERSTDGQTVAEAIDALAAVIGEKIVLRPVAVFEGQVATYLHKRATDLPPQSVSSLPSTVTTPRPPAARRCRSPRCARSTSPATTSRPTSSRTSAASPRRRPAKRASRRRRCRRSSKAGSTASSRRSCCSTSRQRPGPEEDRAAGADEAGVTVTSFARFEVGQAERSGVLSRIVGNDARRLPVTDDRG